MFKPRPQRLRWLFTDCPMYYLTACTSRRQRLPDNERIHDAFVAFGRQAEAYRVLVGRYVLMPDHLHLFAAFYPASPQLSEWMKALKRTLAKELLGHGLTGDCWQKGFFDHALRSEESYAEKWNYVRLNPVRAGLVSDPGDWPYQGEIHHLLLRAL